MDLEATIVQKPGTTERRVHRVTHYSTSDGTVEKVGTITETFTLEKTVRTGDTTCVERIFKGDNSRHYHKHSLPNELANRTEINYCIVNGRIVSIQGFENFFDSVVAKLPVPQRFQDQLLVESYPDEFAEDLANNYAISHLFEGTFPVLTNVTAQLAKKIAQAPLPIDSIVTLDLEKIVGVKTMPFIIYYNIVPRYNHLMLEQLVAAAMGPAGLSEKGVLYKNSAFVSSRGVGKYTVWVDVATGDVVKESDNQQYQNIARHTESGEMLPFSSVQYSEVLYETVTP